MSLSLLAESSKASWPSGALCLLYGPRIFTGPSRTCATASLAARHRQARRLLKLDERGWTDSSGYTRIYLSGKHQYLHRVVMAALLGRPLLTSEHVHHVDGNRSNNRPANLQVLSQEQHMSVSHRKLPLVSFCPQCGAPFLSKSVRRDRRQVCCSRSCARRLDHLRRGRGQRKPARLKTGPQGLKGP